MTWSREIALLLDGTSVAPDANQVLRMHEQIEQGVDWSALLRIAIPQGVLPLLSRNLTRNAMSVIPRTTLVQLQLYSRRVAERNQEQSLELAKLVSALSRDGFRVLPFKGPALATAFYGDIGIRECHDLDLWIDPSQSALAREWFLGAGYRPVQHVQGVPQEVHHAEKEQEGFSSPDGRVLIEMKAHLERSRASRFDPPFEQVWNRRGHISVHGVVMAVMAVEDLLPCLAVHGSKHLWRRLNWIVDIAAVLSTLPEPDGGGMLSRAREWRCKRRLVIAVALAAAFYGIEIPPAMSSMIEERAVRSAVARIRAELFAPKFHTLGSLGSDFVYGLRSSDSMSERLRRARHFLGRIGRADEGRMLVPMSAEMRRVYGAFVTVRNWFGAADTKLQ